MKTFLFCFGAPLFKVTVLLISFNLLTIGIIYGQGGGLDPLNCGSFHLPPANGNPDSLIYDRFGNSYQISDLEIPSSPQSNSNSINNCISGYFNLIWEQDVPVDIQPTICKVFSDLSSIITQSNNSFQCGSTIPPSIVNIQINWDNFTSSNTFGAGTSYLSSFQDGACIDVVLERAFIKINGGRPNPSTPNLLDGTIVLNSKPTNEDGTIEYVWQLDWTAPVQANELDLYTATLHQALHVLGVASRTQVSSTISLWDMLLHSTDDFNPTGVSPNINPVLVPTISSNPPCSLGTSNCWKTNNNIFPTGNIQPAINNTCTLNNTTPDIVVGNNAIAAIDGQNTDGTSEQLSHLSETCNGQNEEYVMRSKLPPGSTRRVISDDELAILCQLGYQISSSTFSCVGCYNIAHSDENVLSEACCGQLFYGCSGVPIEIFNSELLCNDISNENNQEIIRVWGAGQITPNSTGDGWLITASPNNTVVTFNYTVVGCDCRMHNSTFSIWFEKECPPCTYIGDPCRNLLCYNDFENYTNTSQVYTPTLLGYPFIVEGNSTPPSPEIVYANNNHYLTLYAGTGFSQADIAILKLNECVSPGCTLTLDANLARGNNPASLVIWGSTNPPCPATDPSFVSIADNCMQATSCSANLIFDPICIGDIPATSIITNINTFIFDASSHVTFTWENYTNQDVCYIALKSSGPPATQGASPVMVDNISVQRKCEPEITCNILSPTDLCQGEIASISFNVCAPEIPGPDGITLITPNVVLPSGWILVGNNPSPITLSDGGCAQVDIQVQMPPGTPFGTTVDIGLSGTATGICTSNDWSYLATIVVVSCVPGNFTCPCIGVDVLNVDAGDPSSNPTDPLVVPISILDTDIPSHTVSNSPFPNTLWNTCLAIKGNLIIDNNYDLTILGGQIKMQPGARIIVAPGATLRLGLINGGTGLEQGIHGCEQMWRGIEVQPGGVLWTGLNVIQDAEFAFDVKSSQAPISTFSCVGNSFNRNHVGVRVSTGTIDQGVGFSQNKFFAEGGDLLPKFSNDVINWNIQYPYCGLYLNTATFIAGIKTSPASFNEFYKMRNGIIADRSSLFAYYLNIHDIDGTAPGIPNPIFHTSKGIGIHTKSCVQLLIRNSTFNTLSTGMHTYRSPIDIQKGVFQNVDIGLSVNSPAFKEVSIIDNDIYFKNYGVYSWDVASATQVHIEDNNPIELIPNNNPLFSRAGISMGGQAPSVQLFDAQIINNHINLKNNGSNGARGIEIGFSGNWFLKDNIVSYEGTNVASSFFEGIGMVSTDNSYLLHNTITGDNVGTKVRGISLGQSENCKLCCNITDDIHTGFTFHGINPDTKLRHSDIGSHTIGLDIQNGYIDDQPDVTMFSLAGNRWNGAYSISAQHLGGLLDVKNSEFYVELPIGTPLWPFNPFSPAAPGQWFIQWPGVSTYCENDNSSCPEYHYKAPATPYGGPIRNFTNSEIRTASYLFENTSYGKMSKFESSRSLYKKLKENPNLLGSNTLIDQFYSAALANDIGLLYEIDKRIADMWALDSSTSVQILGYEQIIDSFLTEINRIDGLISLASSYNDTLVLLNLKRGLTENMVQHVTSLQTIIDGIELIRQGLIPGVLTLNGSISGSSILASNRKTVNQIYLECIASGTHVLSTYQQNALWAVAIQCPKEGGEAVLQARAIYSQLVAPTEFDDELLCNSAARGIINERSDATIVEQDLKLSIIPNPSKDRFTVLVQGLQVSSPILLKIVDASGKQLKELSALNGDMVTHNLLPGIYFSQVFISEKFVDQAKVIVLP